MEPAERDRLRRKWQENEAELQRLGDLPTGSADPAERERQIDREQDEIEGLMGEAYLAERRSLVPPTDPRHWAGKDLGDRLAQDLLLALSNHVADRIGVAVSMPEFIAAMFRVKAKLGDRLDFEDEAVIRAIEDELRP